MTEVLAPVQALVERFMRLYRGNGRSFGQYSPDSKNKALTIKGTFTSQHVASHLAGDAGLGVVPIMDDGKVWWSAIDIDVHGPAGSPNVDIMAIEQKIARLELPLVVCRSKSGGVHAYVFFSEPQEAASARLMLTRWSTQLGFPGAEVFPKQSTMSPRKGESELPLGNWLNLPYYDFENTDRYCVDGGKQVNIDYFLTLAEARRCTLGLYELATQTEYDPGPPCLQKMLEVKVDEGSRNTAIFQAAVYLKRAFPDSDWRQRLDLFNRQALSNPLGQREVRQIASSVNKREYQYKCREEPCRTMCNRDLCKTRAFGITDKDERANEVPPIDKVQQIIATPMRWILTIKGQQIELTTPALFNYDSVRQAVFEKLHMVLPMMKKQEWDVFLRELCANIEVVEEMTIEEMVRQRAVEFCRRIKADPNVPEDIRRDNLLRGLPAYISIATPGDTTREWFYAFKLLDFIEYLKRKKALMVPEHQISTLLSRAVGTGNKRSKLRVGAHMLTNVWCLPPDVVTESDIPIYNNTPEY